MNSPSWKRRNSETIRRARRREEILWSGSLIPKRAFWQQYRRAKRHGYTGTPGDFMGNDDDRVNLPKLGLVKFHKYRELSGTVRHVSISRTSRGWSISFVCDVGAAPEKLPVRNAVGVNVGLEAFATLSTGERIENPRFFRAGADVLARRQQSLSRKRRGSSSRCRAKLLVTRAHERIRNQRLDFARKTASLLFSRFDLIAHEDLQISRMVHGNLAKSIYDASWGQFLRCLALKAEEAGRHVIAVDPRGTSRIVTTPPRSAFWGAACAWGI